MRSFSWSKSSKRLNCFTLISVIIICVGFFIFFRPTIHELDHSVTNSKNTKNSIKEQKMDHLKETTTSMLELFATTKRQSISNKANVKILSFGQLSKDTPLLQQLSSRLQESSAKSPYSTNFMTLLRSNFYISDFNYRHQPRINYFVDIDSSIWQPISYFGAAEVARRFGAKYIIDLGCGKAYKLNILSQEFKTIGIDIGVNVNQAAKRFPNVSFIEFSLDNAGCQLNINENILKDAVIVTADVIEHLQDPLACYLPLLRTWSKLVHAIVISTPDRGLYRDGNIGPPGSTVHIREWTLTELETMLLDQGLYPVLSGRGCNRLQRCKDSLSGPLNTLTLVIPNSKLTERMLERTELFSFQILIFLVIHPFTDTSIIQENIKHLKTLAAKKFILLTPNNVVMKNLTCGEAECKIVRYSNSDDVMKEVDKLAIDQNTWYFLLDAHEFVYIPRQPGLHRNIPNYLHNVKLQGYNSVSFISGFKMNDYQVPLKLYLNTPWEETTQIGFNSFKSPPGLINVKVWFGNKMPVRASFQKSESGCSIFQKLSFSNQLIYPFSLFSLRHNLTEKHSPASDKITTTEFQQIFSFTFTLGYIEFGMKQLLEPRLLF